MITNLSEQLDAVWIYACAGLFWAVCADILHCLRQSVRGYVVGMLLDLLFMSLGAILLFLVTVSVVQDDLRGYMPLSFFGAFVLWHATVGKCIRMWLDFLSLIWARVARKFFRIIRGIGRTSTVFLYPLQGYEDKKNGKKRKNTSLF